MTLLTKTTIKPKGKLQLDNRFWQYYSILKYIGLRGISKLPPKMMKNDVFNHSYFKKNSNLSFDLFWPGISPQQCILTKWFILQHYWKLWASGETKMTPLNCQKMFLIQNIYLTNNDWNLWDFWPDISAQPWILTTWFIIPNLWKL